MIKYYALAAVGALWAAAIDSVPLLVMTTILTGFLVWQDKESL